jgi:hypothetical protein
MKKPRRLKRPKKPVKWIEDRILYISIPFTWNLPSIKSEIDQKNFLYDKIIIGGPAICLIPDFFNDCDNVIIGNDLSGILQTINPYATKTSIGCPNKCSFCGVKKINGDFQELKDWPDLPVLIDDNLLATSQNHFDKVIDRLIKWGWADFNQGLDSRLLTEYHAERLSEIKQPVIRLALDNMSYADKWLNAVEKLKKAKIAKSKIRSYSIVGYKDNPDKAWEKCKIIEKYAGQVLPMWYHPLNSLKHNEFTKDQIETGWTNFERRRLFGWYYFHVDITTKSNKKVLTDQMRF